MKQHFLFGLSPVQMKDRIQQLLERKDPVPLNSKRRGHQNPQHIIKTPNRLRRTGHV
jgi:hypothetical protein